MKVGWRRAITRILLLALMLLGAAVARAPAVAQADPNDAASRQILVMLRLPASHLRLNQSYGGDYGDAATRAALRRIADRVARQNELRVIEDWPMPLIGIDCFLMEAAPGTSIDEVVRSVSRHNAVEWAQPMQTYRMQSGTSRGDTLYRAQPSAAAWQLDELHRLATGRGVVVAVVDTGIELRHPDLAGQFQSGQDFVDGRPLDSEAHGTGVAGVIAARRDNGVGIVGIAPAARLMALRACHEAPGGGTASCNTLSLARALYFAIENGAGIINLSLSGPHDILLQRLVNVAIRRRAVIVAAYDSRLPQGGFPASEPGVIAVGDAALPSQPANVYGALARDIPTTQPGGTWDLVNGTSYAAAHVSGLVALLREQGRAVRLVRSGNGAIDACATLTRVTPTCDCSCAVAREGGATAHH